MDDQIKKILFEELPKTHYGKALEIYLQEEMEKLNDVSTITTWDETLARKKGAEILKKILKFLNIDSKPDAKKTSYK